MISIGKILSKIILRVAQDRSSKWAERVPNRDVLRTESLGRVDHHIREWHKLRPNLSDTGLDQDWDDREARTSLVPNNGEFTLEIYCFTLVILSLNRIKAIRCSGTLSWLESNGLFLWYFIPFNSDKLLFRLWFMFSIWNKLSISSTRLYSTIM